MSPTDPARVREIFEAALEVDPEHRRAFVGEACGGVARLEDRVSHLLEIDARGEADSFLERPPLRPARRSVKAIERVPPEPESIGEYLLLGKIAEGGTSSVYLAQGRAGQPAEVALKVLRARSDDGSAWRSARERAILSRLDHPLIPRVLDSGATPEGRPFLVMELVDGEPITEFCDRHRLPTRSRIELFLRICEAVAFVHRHLVVHRDLKPTNILVDRGGTPRLLDFGISKWLEPSSSPGRTTVTADRALTPDYAAPEQFLGGEVTTAIDVYALGVVLYELLSGTRPHAWRGVPIPDLLERWQHTPPIAPSQTLADGGSSEPGRRPAGLRAELRSSSAAALRRHLEGDLDTIALKALRFEAGRRYVSVRELADDLERFLDGHAIRARPATWGYRMAKFARRNTLAVSQAAALLVLILFFSINSVFESRRIARERDLAEAARMRAEEERGNSERVTSLLLEAYRVIDPYRGQGSRVRAEDILTNGARLSSETLSQAPAARARVEHTLGRMNLGLGFFERAEEHLQTALALGESVHGAGSLEAAAVRASLAEVFTKRNRFEAAEREIRRAIAIQHARGPGRADQTLGTYYRHLAGVLVERGQFEEAERLAREAVEFHRQGGSGSELALDLNVLLEVQIFRGAHDSALATGEEALRTSRQVFPAGSAAIAESLAGRALARWHLRDFDEAMSDTREALALARDSLGEWHPSVAAITNNLGLFHLSQGNLEAAEPLLRRGIEIFRASFDRPHADLLRSQSNLARVLMQSERQEEAVGLLEACVAGYRSLYGEDHPLVAEALQHLGSTYYIAGRLEPARSHLASALNIRRQVAADDRSTRGANRILLARVERELGNLDQARHHLESALEHFADLEGDLGSWLNAIAGMRLAEVLLDLGRTDEAEVFVRGAIRTFSETDDRGHQAKRIECRGILGRVLVGQGRVPEAERELLGSHRELRTASWTSAEQQAEAARRLVQFYEGQGRASEADRYRAQSLRGFGVGSK